MITAELLTPIRVTELRPFLVSVFEKITGANETMRLEFSAEQILTSAEAGLCHVFVAIEDGNPVAALAIQFYLALGVLHANMMAFSGVHMSRCIRMFWPPVCDWMAACGAKSVTTNASAQMAKVLARFTKFTTESIAVRMPLGV